MLTSNKYLHENDGLDISVNQCNDMHLTFYSIINFICDISLVKHFKNRIFFWRSTMHLEKNVAIFDDITK